MIEFIFEFHMTIEKDLNRNKKQINIPHLHLINRHIKRPHAYLQKTLT